MKAKKNAETNGIERRRAKRTLVQESFSLFLVISQAHGMVRLYMRDLSRLGLSFHSEFANELSQGQEFPIRLYINPSFYLPIEARVVRVQGDEIGLEFLKPDSKSVQAVSRLLDFLDTAADAGELGE